MTDRVALFATCLGDTLYPQVGRATVAVLERLGIAVDFPRDQTCCGQMHLNAGYPDEARALARRFVEVFADWEVVVAPSGSCVAHVREHYRSSSAPSTRCTGSGAASSRSSSPGSAPTLGSSCPGSVAYHPTCHSLRMLQLGDTPLRLLRAVRGLELVELPDAEECCGFGGTFAVKNAAVSTAMLNDKIASIEASGADAVCACDSSCLMHIGGGPRAARVAGARRSPRGDPRP